MLPGNALNDAIRLADLRVIAWAELLCDTPADRRAGSQFAYCLERLQASVGALSMLLEIRRVQLPESRPAVGDDWTPDANPKGQQDGAGDTSPLGG